MITKLLQNYKILGEKYLKHTNKKYIHAMVRTRISWILDKMWTQHDLVRLVDCW